MAARSRSARKSHRTQRWRRLCLVVEGVAELPRPAVMHTCMRALGSDVEHAYFFVEHWHGEPTCACG